MARTWNPTDITASVNGYVVEGYAEGTFIEVETTEDRNTYTAGSDSTGTFNRNPNQSGTIKFTLQRNATSVNTLEAIDLLETPVPIIIMNHNEGGEKVVASSCMLQKLPVRTGSKEVANVDVVFID